MRVKSQMLQHFIPVMQETFEIASMTFFSTLFLSVFPFFSSLKRLKLSRPSADQMQTFISIRTHVPTSSTSSFFSSSFSSLLPLPLHSPCSWNALRLVQLLFSKSKRERERDGEKTSAWTENIKLGVFCFILLFSECRYVERSDKIPSQPIQGRKNWTDPQQSDRES